MFIDNKTKKINTGCNIKLQHELLSKANNSIIIFFGRLPLYLTNYFFDNQEGGKEKEDNKFKYSFTSRDKNMTIEKSFKKEILNLTKKNKIILVYPFPEAGWKISPKLLRLLPKDRDLIKKYLVPENYITTSYQVYKDRTKSSFELLDSIIGDNIFRVYPHTLFCDTTIKNRCITHDDKNIFYLDDDHPSLKGAEMINDLIMKEIEKIELK